MSGPVKCVMILSARSSGSSALQNLLTKTTPARHVDATRHFEHETLFWLKAAAVLGLPQIGMADARLPFAADAARADLVALLRDNIGAGYAVPEDSDALIFGGWRDLCQRYAPAFVEKSPHHLHQWAALQLIAASIVRVPEVDLLLVGLVRNPMDTMYSMWQRWRGMPEENERDWITAYQNLLRFRERLGERLLILRYEDMVRDPALLRPVYGFLEVDARPSDYLHRESLGKWRNDPRFGFRLSEETLALAEQYGYRRDDMIGTARAPLWPLYRRASRIYVRRVQPILRRLWRNP
ncbi:MAG TPA: sulfotransferase [Roseiflexaceae bacterium]|nr:sulfotransferase [Roseiflexaceae bacterium]